MITGNLLPRWRGGGALGSLPTATSKGGLLQIRIPGPTLFNSVTGFVTKWACVGRSHGNQAGVSSGCVTKWARGHDWIERRVWASQCEPPRGLGDHFLRWPPSGSFFVSGYVVQHSSLMSRYRVQLAVNAECCGVNETSTQDLSFTRKGVIGLSINQSIQGHLLDWFKLDRLIASPVEWPACRLLTNN